jgi:uncharacterized membrane protein
MTSSVSHTTPTPSAAVQKVDFDRPWDWLGAGWRDLTAVPGLSLTYGALVAGAGSALTFGLHAMGHEALLPVVAGGFLLVGPLLAVGLYDISRKLASGERPTLAGSFAAGLRAAARMGLLTAFLLFVYLVWLRVAFLLFALFFGSGGMPPSSEFMRELLFTPHGLALLSVGTLVGAILAAIVFATTVVAIPMILDREVDTLTAISTSVRAVVANPFPMGLWAALIAGFVILGLLTIGAGLVVAFPLLGHATWHAYRDTIR